jgi:hypothetical protein
VGRLPIEFSLQSSYAEKSLVSQRFCVGLKTFTAVVIARQPGPRPVAIPADPAGEIVAKPKASARRPPRNRQAEACPSASVSVLGQRGGSPLQARTLRPVTDSNCVAARRGGEQLKVNDQSVTQVNSIRPY